MMERQDKLEELKRVERGKENNRRVEMRSKGKTKQMHFKEERYRNLQEPKFDAGEDSYCILRYDTVQPGRWAPIFRRIVVLTSSGFKMQAHDFFETYVPSTRLHGFITPKADFHISARKSTILTDIFMGFLQSHRICTWIVPQLCHCRSLPDPFRFSIH